jgi:F-type H+-transporting ATPase subunit epsilon
MAALFHLALNSPTGTAFDGSAVSVVAPGAAGRFGVLADHAPMICALEPGPLKIVTEGGVRRFRVGGGVLEVSANRVMILTDSVDETPGGGEPGTDTP